MTLWLVTFGMSQRVQSALGLQLPDSLNLEL